MAINTDLLVMAPMLQDYLVDKDTGMPLANGEITLWVDTQRYIEYKNWYYQTGTPGAYTWIALDNPMHLSSVGTIQDPNGNDVIPFYYPHDEDNENSPQTYFIEVYSVDENGDRNVLQFTRENFPFTPSNVSPTAQNPTWRNYILNNVYWRNCGNFDATNETNKIIAPSQHDGYTNGDIRLLKNVTGAVDSLSFTPMTEVLDNDITPEYSIDYVCDGVQVGETVKCIQYPVSLHVKTLQNVEASVVIQAQNVAGNTNNYLDIYVYQYLGTGALSQPDPILIKRITLNNTFQKFILPFIFPDTDGLVLGNGGDDALFIRVQYPLSALFAINHTKPQLYLSNDVPDNDFDTYDQVETIINSPRTGDIRSSINAFQPFGYILMNDGTIGDSTSGATRQNIDTWPLFNLLWNGVGATYAPMFTSAGAPVAYGANAIADWNAHRRISLTKTLGRALASAGAPSSGTNTGTTWALGQTTGNENVTITQPNLPTHTHAAPVGSGGQFVATGGTNNSYNNTGANAGQNFASTGGMDSTVNSAMTTQPPTTYLNVFMKL